jgi:ribosome recycling factor
VDQALGDLAERPLGPAPFGLGVDAEALDPHRTIQGLPHDGTGDGERSGGEAEEIRSGGLHASEKSEKWGNRGSLHGGVLWVRVVGSGVRMDYLFEADLSISSFIALVRFPAPWKNGEYLMATPIELAKPDFAHVLGHLEQELKSVRGGRASAALVDMVRVESYGSMMEIKALASISVPDPKTVQIEPWDKNVVKDIEKALIAANLGMMPNVAGTVIRLVMPPMTEQNRKDMVKIISQKGEQARISLRAVREAVREKILKMEEDKQIGEDEKFRLLDQLDEFVKTQNVDIEKMVSEKEEEIMTI